MALWKASRNKAPTKNLRIIATNSLYYMNEKCPVKIKPSQGTLFMIFISSKIISSFVAELMIYANAI